MISERRQAANNNLWRYIQELEAVSLAVAVDALADAPIAIAAERLEPAGAPVVPDRVRGALLSQVDGMLANRAFDGEENPPYSNGTPHLVYNHGYRARFYEYPGRLVINNTHMDLDTADRITFSAPKMNLKHPEPVKSAFISDLDGKHRRHLRPMDLLPAKTADEIFMESGGTLPDTSRPVTRQNLQELIIDRAALTKFKITNSFDSNDSQVSVISETIISRPAPSYGFDEDVDDNPAPAAQKEIVFELRGTSSEVPDVIRYVLGSADVRDKRALRGFYGRPRGARQEEQELAPTQKLVKHILSTLDPDKRIRKSL